MTSGRDGAAGRVVVQGISFVLGARWRPAWPLGAEATGFHGIYLVHEETGLQLHVRSYGMAGGRRELLEHLRGQQWGGDPFDVTERGLFGLQIVAGTFATRQPAEHVREWFISDGVRGANAALCLFPPDISSSVLAECEALVDSIGFVERPA